MNLAKKIKFHLPSHTYHILKLIGEEADALNYKAFCVGGFVRDLFLNVKNFDIDIAVEKDAIHFGRILSRRLKGILVVHKKFGTATIIFSGKDKNKIKIDIATARTERYQHPAALPEVKFASIKHDLYRRDFTVNAMAISINKRSFGSLIDFFGGLKDLRSRRIKTLHDLSFIDDPTRIFRAVRFEQRYNFKIEPHTEKLIKTAISLDMFGRTQNQRIRNEIILILSENEPIKALCRMNQLHELRFIDRELKLNKHTMELFKAIRQVQRWYNLYFSKQRAVEGWVIYFMAVIDVLSLRQIKLICEKFVFKKSDEKRILSGKMATKKISRLLDKKVKICPSIIYKHLQPLSYEVILFIAASAKTKKAKNRLHLFFSRYNNIKLSITGKDLKEIGLAPGPRYKKILNSILYAKLDGKIKTKKEEMELAKK